MENKEKILREKLKELNVKSSYNREAIIFMYFNNKPLLTKEIWSGIDKHHLKISTGITPDSTLSERLGYCSDNSTHKGEKSKNIYFHIEMFKPRHKYILKKECREHVDLLMGKSLTIDEKELLKFAKEFKEFLTKDPQIRYNLHEIIREINDKFNSISSPLYLFIINFPIGDFGVITVIIFPLPIFN